ncbi:hypothetical protein PBY51_015398 [Eleginops maclovinus]|uniref:Uncharacterized protein n=1 Tax=Eleginops maclovinus TaxID=56733 RepID=A0AAN7X4C1_ELEMC|nr:hypothetical protein PBY51_015398 [Eleginops maclovinus]
MHRSVIVCAVAAPTCNRHQAGTTSDLLMALQLELRDAAAQRRLSSLTLPAQDLAAGLNGGQPVPVRGRSGAEVVTYCTSKLVGLTKRGKTFYSETLAANLFK